MEKEMLIESTVKYIAFDISDENNLKKRKKGMKGKRIFVMIIILIISVCGTITIYGATSVQNIYKYSGKASLAAYAFIIDDTYWRHSGTSKGSLLGEDRDSVGILLVKTSFGDTKKLKYIGYNQSTYSITYTHVGFFDTVTTAVSNKNSPETNIVSAKAED